MMAAGLNMDELMSQILARKIDQRYMKQEENLR